MQGQFAAIPSSRHLFNHRRKQPTMTVPTKPRPIWAAYAAVGALAVSCPTCGAERGQWCSKPDGRVGRIPCVARTAATGIVAGDGDTSRDFSEPLHGAEA